MHCISLACEQQYPTPQSRCPNCRMKNPLYGVSLLVATDHHEIDGAFTSTITSPSEVNGTGGIQISARTHKFALEMHYGNARRQYIVFENVGGIWSAVCWDPTIPGAQTILPQSSRCSICPGLNNASIPHTLVVCPVPGPNVKWNHHITDSPDKSHELSVVLSIRGQTAAWTIHLSHQN